MGPGKRIIIHKHTGFPKSPPDPNQPEIGSLVTNLVDYDLHFFCMDRYDHNLWVKQTHKRCVKQTKHPHNPWLKQTGRCPSQWRHNGRDDVSNHQPLDYLLNRLFWRSSKKTSKLRVTALCEGNSQMTGEFPAQGASDAENVSISSCSELARTGVTVTMQVT